MASSVDVSYSIMVRTVYESKREVGGAARREEGVVSILVLSAEVSDKLK